MNELAMRENFSRSDFFLKNILKFVILSTLMLILVFKKRIAKWGRENSRDQIVTTLLIIKSGLFMNFTENERIEDTSQKHKIIQIVMKRETYFF